MAGSCKHSSETWDYNRGGEFLGGFGSYEQGKPRVQCEDTSDRPYARYFASMFFVKVLELNCST